MGAGIGALKHGYDTNSIKTAVIGATAVLVSGYLLKNLYCTPSISWQELCNSSHNKKKHKNKKSIKKITSHPHNEKNDHPTNLGSNDDKDNERDKKEDEFLDESTEQNVEKNEKQQQNEDRDKNDKFSSSQPLTTTYLYIH